jgi:dihydrodipicolinate synthase/N-acetylneuraminate lyase
MLKGAIAAAVTPLRDGGRALDEGVFAPLVAFLAAGGVDGMLALGTTGEGIMLSVDERERAAELFLQARPAGFDVAVHCGAQSTIDTVRLAAHAARLGADAVAVIGPPYFAFDERGLFDHFRAAADACAPLPFYVYEFAQRSGYPLPLSLIQRLRETTTNLVGLKVSDTPFDRVEPYLVAGLDVFIGSEPLTLEGMSRGAVGAVSGLATAFPEIVAQLVRDMSEDAHHKVVLLRDRLADIPFQAALKAVLAERGVPVREHVRPPLRTLDVAERVSVLAAARAVGAL